MTLEISLRPPFSISRLFHAHSDEPDQAYHWLSPKQDTSQRPAEPKKQDRKPQEEIEEQEYRPLSKIKLGEVEDALGAYTHHLIPVASPAAENWIGKNFFCRIPLKRINDGRPPEIFGRVKTCYPSDGHIDNIETVELLFPRKAGTTDRVLIHKDEISRYSQSPAQSFYLRLQFKASREDEADFEGAGSSFRANGFYPDLDDGFADLLQMNEQNQSMYPRLYVMGSRWFDSIPDTVHAEMQAKLKEMLQWGKLIFNYHPDWLPKEINTLNKVLGFKYEFTSTLLTEPSNPQETAFIVAKLFERAISPADKKAK